jgi:hypothetical protein
MDPLLKRARRAGVGPVVLKAATGTLNLTIAGVGGVAAAALHSVPVALLGGAAYLALVAWDAMSPAFQKTVRDTGKPAGVNFAPLLEQGDQRVWAFAAALITAQQRRVEALADTNEGTLRFLEAALAQVPGLEQHAVALLERYGALLGHLDLEPRERLEHEQAELERRAEQTRDPEAREQLRLALEAKRGQLATRAELATTAERIEAHLTNILSVLEGVPAKLVNMRALDDTHRDAYSSDVRGDLARLDAELSAFEETLKPVLSAQRSLS